MGFFFKSSSSTNLPWTALSSVDQLKEIIESSTGKPALLFKHSTRCSISSMAKNRFEDEWKVSEEKCDIYYLDLLTYREVSNEIESLLGVVHQSPQAIVISNTKPIYNASHGAISAGDIEKLLD